jgi:F-type H+-transporting ATPase subunit delta
MKIRKEALRAARLLLKASMPGGRVDEGKVREYTARILKEKPRQYVQILEALHRMLRLELEKRHANIESFEELDEATRTQVLAGLAGNFGDGLTSEFKVNHDLIGGMRVKVGSTIWDGSVRERINSLRQAIGA